MDHNSIIDKKTFEIYTHAEDYPNAIICDKEIAPAIATLNKKGYKTLASCSGHYKISFYEWLDQDLKYLDEIKKINKNIIKRIGDKSFDYWSEVTETYIYILFDNKYDFSILPEGFEERDSNDRTSLEHKINYYDENDNRLNQKEIIKEIEKYCEILYKWASNLPERKDDKYE